MRIDDKQISGTTIRGTFPRSAHLLRHADFDRVYKQGKRHFASLITVFYLNRSRSGGLRIGLTVGRALGGAVSRNRIKRRLREAIRKYYYANDVDVDVVINPKKLVLTAEFSELLNQMERAFQVIRKSQGSR